MRLRAALSFTLATLPVACGDDTPSHRTDPEPTVCASCGPCDETRPIVASAHVDGPVTYVDDPPSSGDHWACWATWGVHDDVVPEERWVHNLEHGGVVFLVNCKDGCPDDADAIQELKDFAATPPFKLFTVDADLPAKFAAVAWGRRLVTDCIDVDAARAFFESHSNRAPESVPDDPSPSCN